jgi:hypothetical protein
MEYCSMNNRDSPKRFIIMDGTTICEDHARSEIEEEQPRKRRRLFEDYIEERTLSKTNLGPAERDKEFYTEDARVGECILQAGKTLFKVCGVTTIQKIAMLKMMP